MVKSVSNHDEVIQENIFPSPVASSIQAGSGLISKRFYHCEMNDAISCKANGPNAVPQSAGVEAGIACCEQ
jgi:hypothetical protein